MHFKHNNMFATLTKFTLSAMLALGFFAEVKAEEKKADPTGNWTWMMKGRQGRPDRKITAKIKLEGDKVTGKVISPGRDGQANETEIQDGKLKNDEVSFSITREFNGNKMVMKYNGKLSGDAIKGTIASERNGEPVNQDWEAKRGGTDATTDAK